MPPRRPPYVDSVFIDCPFDTAYGALLDAVVFAVHDCGFVARKALELPDSGRTRLDRLIDLIGSCKYGIHDLSRTELDPINQLPHMNMRAVSPPRDRLHGHSGAKIPGGKKMSERYQAFRAVLPSMCETAGLDQTALTPADYTGLVTAWLNANQRLT